VSILLSSNDQKEKLLAMVNVSNKNVHLKLVPNELGWNKQQLGIQLVDIFSGELIKESSISEGNPLIFEPYQARWIKERHEG
jgi:hypothetical protein